MTNESNKSPAVVADIMTRNIITLREEENLLSIEDGMERFALRHLPVVDGDKLVGLITHRDVLRFTHSRLRSKDVDRAIDERKQQESFVASVMRRNIKTVTPDTPLKQAAKMLIDNRIGCLPVVEQDNTLVGIITEYDFAKLFAEQ
jgi:CBS domain-containing membrane protein